MDDALLDVVLCRLKDKPLKEDTAALLLAALRGDTLLLNTDGLAGLLGGQAAGGGEGEPPGRSVDMARAYLRSVTVAGFRGVGRPATMDLQPGPGLTLVVGRNGSGKSSFAEALEVLVTGELRRYHKRPAVWREGWRNLHAPGGPRIDASFLLEDAGEVTVSRSWGGSDDIADSLVAGLDGPDGPGGPGGLDWDDALRAYRPFLTHTELESFLGSPSELYDMLSAVLGLEDLTLAATRLDAERGVLEAAVRAVSGELPGVLARLAGVDDERAAACLAALERKRPDTERAQALTSGNARAAEDSSIGRLRRLAALSIPGQDEVSAAAGALTRAAEDLEATAGSRSEEARALADLLDAALAHYDTHGDGPCPVCGQAAALSARWARDAAGEVERLRSQAGAAQAARRGAASAAATARRLFAPVPSVLADPGVLADGNGGAVDAAARAWREWAACPAVSGESAGELRDMAGHIGRTWPELRESVSALAAAAEAEVRSREDRWAPVAEQVAAWCARKLRADADAKTVSSVKAAQAWLRAATDDIRNARLAPLAEHARAIWAQLRQDSNVSLDAIRLSGSRNRRQADVAATVDGLDSPALAVMSQGEVNALALSIFLPHAMLPASPFGFVVIDDPVQAMDPAKVDGLARVLADASRSRQMVVFTHDDRLTQAVRHLAIPAHILEVTRRPGSVTDVRTALTPAQQHLRDAGALCADHRLPPGLADQVVPGLCRLAVEAAFTEAIWRRGLRAGQRHSDIEDAIEAATKPKQRPALALFGDCGRTAEVYPKLNRWAPWAADTFRSVNEGTHAGHLADARRLVGDARRLVELIGAKLP